MGDYLWQAKDQHQQVVEGMDKAPNGWLLPLMLAQQGLQMTACYRLWPWSRRWELPAANLRMQLLQQWQRLVAAQLPLMDVVRLSIPAKATTRLRWQLWCLQGLLRQGNTFTQALGAVKLLTQVDTALLAAAEEGGYLATMLAQLVGQEQARQRLRKQLQRSLLMPAITLLAGLVVAMLLLLWLVPNMAGMLAGQVQELPALTSNLLKLSLWLQNWWQYLALAVCSLMLLLWRAMQSATMAQQLYGLLSYLPLLGELIQLQQQWRLYQLLGTGMQGGVTLLRCLNLYLPCCQLIRFRQRIGMIEADLLAGDTLPEAFAKAGLPQQQIIMLSMAQRTGQLPEVCMHIAKDLDQQISDRMQIMQSLIEPAVTLLLAILVGSLVLAIYLPLLQLGTMLR